MNNALIEREVQKRVRFKMSEFWDSFNNQMRRNKYILGATRDKEMILRAKHNIESYEEIKGILRKEIDLPTAFDGEIEKNIWEAKEVIVNEISERLLKKGTPEYWSSKSFINNKIEEFIDGN
jgi:hypothetical protein